MLATPYFREQGEQVEIIKLNGSIELAPIIGFADRIVDIVSTGQNIRGKWLSGIWRQLLTDDITAYCESC